jgi:hypothetical protein
LSGDAVSEPEGVYCTTQVATRSWRLHVDARLRADDEVALVIQTDALALRRIVAARDFLAGLQGGTKVPALARRNITRSALVHRATLQALDGAAAGASQRDIAIAIWGKRAVLERWSSDGELRARVRYFMRRGHALVQGGYRKLAYQ